MADLIAYTNYKTLADHYASARERVLLVKDDLFDAVYQVVLLQELLPEVDLLYPFYDSYLLSSNEFKTPASLLDAVRALNSHVLTRGDYDNINEYLWENNAHLLANNLDITWQTLSGEAGYEIDDVYVSDTV